MQAAQYQDWAVHPDHMPPQPQGEAPKTVQQREAEYLQQASDERHLAATDTDVVKKMAEVTGGLAAIGVGGLLVVVRRSRRGGQS